MFDLSRRSTHPALWAPLQGGDFPKQHLDETVWVNVEAGNNLG
jgi:hypothetical protein